MKGNYTILIIFALTLFGIVVRLLPHVPNATPITAIAFVCSMYIGKRWSLILPMGILILSDTILGFYDWRIMLSVYGSFALIGCWSWISRKYKTVKSILLMVIFSSILFFLITNASVWFFSPWYEKSFSGLLYSYELGIPFLRNMFIGDIMYTTILMMTFEIAKSRKLNTPTNGITGHGLKPHMPKL